MRIRPVRVDGRRAIAWWRGVVAAVAAVATLGAGTLASNALFTDSATTDSAEFTAGSIQISATADVAVPLNYTNMFPGDAVTSKIVVRNIGSGDLRYSVVSTSNSADDNYLAQQIVLEIKQNVSTCTGAGFGASGTSIYLGRLGSTTGWKVLGDAAAGAHTGDRLMVPTATETLCLQARLPLNSANGYQTRSASTSFLFDAEQTKNNP